MIDRRHMLQVMSAGVVASTGLVSGCASAWQSSPKDMRGVPKISGPVSGGHHGRPFGAFLGDLAAVGYVEEEYFLSGNAASFEPVGEHLPDGKWSVRAAGDSPYVTRVLVRRPKESSRFNGCVILEWLNVSVGFDLSIIGTHVPSFYKDGFAFAAVSCQKVSVEGFVRDGRGLKQWDPDRYGSLSLPHESTCYDIFTQTARALGPGRAFSGDDPMKGLRVRRVIGTGASQSAVRLRGYINAIHPLANAFDAFVPLLDFGTTMGFDDKTFDSSAPAGTRNGLFSNHTRIRDDLKVPVHVVNTQSETLSYYQVRQPDTERFRYWEIAGASHDPAPSLRHLRQILSRDDVALGEGEIVASEVEWRPTADAAFAHMKSWLDQGTAPPKHEPIEVRAGETPQIVLDERGNAKGGIRLPEVEVPVATYAFGGRMDLSGKTTGFSDAVLKQLYPNRDAYVSAVRSSAERAAAGGFIPAWRVEQYVTAAQSVAL